MWSQYCLAFGQLGFSHDRSFTCTWPQSLLRKNILAFQNKAIGFLLAGGSCISGCGVWWLILMLAMMALSSGSEVTRLRGLRGGTKYLNCLLHRQINCGERQSGSSMSQNCLSQTPVLKRKMLASPKFPFL